jgi:hypothetical protein
MREMLATRLQEYLAAGAEVATSRSNLGSLLGYALRMNPRVTAQIRPELPERYQTYGRVSYLSFIVVAPNARSSGVYRSLMETTCRELCDSDVMVGRVQEDSFRAMLVHSGYAGQLFAPDTVEVQSDLDPLESAIFRTRDRTRALGFVVPISDYWREEFGRTRPSSDELAKRVSDVINYRSPGYHQDGGAGLVDAWSKNADRLLYLGLQAALRAECASSQPEQLSRKVGALNIEGNTETFEMRQVIAAVLPSYCVEHLRDRGLLGVRDLTELERAQIQNMIMRSTPSDAKLASEISEIQAWKVRVSEFLERAFGSEQLAEIQARLGQRDQSLRHLAFPSGLTFPEL